MKPLVVANWKMNTSLSDAIVLTQYLKNNFEDSQSEVVLCPPFVWLYPMQEILEKRAKNIHLGAQNIFYEEKGAYTGEVSPVMIKSLANYVIVGHCERKKYLHESFLEVAKKVKVAVKNDLRVILCIGENKKTNLTKPNFDQIFDQMNEILRSINKKEMENIILVYEPVWAISTNVGGEPASGIYANMVVEKMREKITRKYGSEIAHHTRILYGGSVNASNAQEFLHQKEINGVLVGASSLKAREFIKICNIAASK
ncbi:MAG: hypothetical protein ACD_58C00120G0011 [uncultured bacterium]|nr:MAG: hypothetical protein ACD_58C00120G0011 [uncultured bacterium]